MKLETKFLKYKEKTNKKRIFDNLVESIAKENSKTQELWNLIRKQNKIKENIFLNLSILNEDKEILNYSNGTIYTYYVNSLKKLNIEYNYNIISIKPIKLTKNNAKYYVISKKLSEFLPKF